MLSKPVYRPFPLPPNEQERLAALDAYEILDTPRESPFDRIAALASRLFETPMSLVSLVAEKRQWFKAKCGIAWTETPRAASFCTHCILGQDALVVCDATKDPRFKDNPLVVGHPAIRFYAGAPLKTPAGLPLGTVCVMDAVAREYPPQHLLDSLADLAYLAVGQLESRLERVHGPTEEQEALSAREARFQEAQELVHIGYWEHDLRSGSVSWSEEAYRLLGVSPQTQLTFEQFQEMLPIEDRRAFSAVVDNGIATGEPFRITHRIVRGDGSMGNLEARCRVARTSQGASRVLGAMMDVTARVEADLLLENSNEELERRIEQRTRLLDRSKAALLAEFEEHMLTQAILSGQNRILREIAAGLPIAQVFDNLLQFGETEANRGFVGSIFLKCEDGKSLRRVAAPSFHSEIKTALPLIAIAPQGNPAAAAAYFGERVITAIRTGAEFPGARLFHEYLGARNVASTPILGKENEVLGTVSFAMGGEPTAYQLRVLDACAHLASVALLRDTEQANLRLSEQTVREVERRLQVGLGFARVAVWTWSNAEDTVTWSGPVKQVFGLDPSELKSYAALREIMLPEDRAVVDRKLSDSIGDGRQYSAEFRVVHPSGDIRWIAGIGGATFAGNGQVVQLSGVHFDITERKLAEQKLAVSELHFRELAESMPQIVWTTNALGEFEYCNRRWYQVSGLPQATTDRQAWQRVLHQDDAIPWLAAQTASRRDGRQCEMEFRIWDAAQQLYRWHLGRQEPIVDVNGAVTRCYGTCTDIHHRKMEEIKLAASERALRCSVNEKETLLKEVHHRVKNNLQVICSLLRMQELSLERDSAASAALKDSQQRVLAMALIHERLYGGTQLDEIDFAEYARALVEELFASFSNRAACIDSRFNVSSVLLNIDQAIPCGLILNELVSNALKYAYPEGQGEILVELSEAAGRVCLTVSDHGIGLPDGFDWSKCQSMGLPIADLLAKQIDGTLTAQSQPGAKFTVEFPRQSKEAKGAKAVSA